MVDTLGLEPSALTGVRVRLSYPLLGEILVRIQSERTHEEVSKQF